MLISDIPPKLGILLSGTLIFRNMSLLPKGTYVATFNVKITFNVFFLLKNWMFNFVSLLKDKRQMTGNKLCKPAQHSGAGLRIICYPSSDVYPSINWQNQTFNSYNYRALKISSLFVLIESRICYVLSGVVIFHWWHKVVPGKTQRHKRNLWKVRYMVKWFLSYDRSIIGYFWIYN